MKLNAPLSVESLTSIFRTSPKDPLRLIKREDSNVEFKESYNHASMSMYFKTVAAFANNAGGYLIFGIGNNPRKLIGLKDRNLKQFEELRVEDFTKNLYDYFSPEIKWEHCTFEYQNMFFGIIYVYELMDKPAICKKSYDSREEKYSLKEGEIYYRYGGRSERIRYSELQRIIESKRRLEEREWLKFMMRASKVGIRNSALLDLNSGKLDGAGGSIILDESLLSKIAFIKEGSFKETEGKPTLRLIGDVAEISTGKIVVNQAVVKVKGIQPTDIIESFLKNEKVDQPIEYIKQICFASSGNMPVYYYMSLAGISTDDTLRILNKTSARGQAKDKLIDRLTSKKIPLLLFPTKSTPASHKKKEYTDLWLNESLPDEFGDELDYCLQSLLYLSDDEITRHAEYIKEELFLMYKKHYEKAKYSSASNIRVAICRIDESLYSR